MILLTPWWPSLLAIPATLIAGAAVITGLCRLIIRAVRRDQSAEALRIAILTRDQYAELVEAQRAHIVDQHDTNVDIDRRLKLITTEKQSLERRIAELTAHISDQDATLFTQSDQITDLKTTTNLQASRLSRMEAERDDLRRRVALLEQQREQLLRIVSEHGIAIPSDLQDNAPPTS